MLHFSYASCLWKMKKMAEKGPQNASRRLGAPPSDGWKATPEAIERIFLYKKYTD